MFWIGLVVGMFIGMFLGIMIMALMEAARIGDEKTEAALAEKGMRRL